MINEEQSYFRLRENIRAKDHQLSEIELYRLIEHGKRIGQNARQSLKLKTGTQEESTRSIEIVRQCYHIVWNTEWIQSVKT